MNGVTVSPTGGATWSTWNEMIAVVTRPRHMKRTATVALVVGSIFVAMNQLGSILAGDATPLVWIKAALTYLTPLCVSNIGILSATHQSDPHEAEEKERNR